MANRLDDVPNNWRRDPDNWQYELGYDHAINGKPAMTWDMSFDDDDWKLYLLGYADGSAEKRSRAEADAWHLGIENDNEIRKVGGRWGTPKYENKERKKIKITKSLLKSLIEKVLREEF